MWKACERFGILPPDVESSWVKCDIAAQAALIGYDQIRDYERQEERDQFYDFFSKVM